MGTLQGKIAVITGGNSGIGLETAREFIAQGAKVIITGRNRESTFAAAAMLGNNSLGIVSDQANLSDVDKLVHEVKTKYGHVDALLINAGIAALAPFESLSEEQYDSTMNINFKGAFFTVQKFLPLLRTGSSVTFLSSINAFTGMPNTGVYGPSKAALNALGRVLATELASKGIRVNNVNPGPVKTPIFGKVGLPPEAITQFATTMSQRVPLKRFGLPEEVAKMVAYISSDAAAFVTGADFVIDGGLNLNPVLG